jgi:hypothetical protein
MKLQPLDEVPIISMADAADYMDKQETKKRGRPKLTEEQKAEREYAPKDKLAIESANHAREASASRAKRVLATRDIFDAAVAKYGCPIEAMAEIGFDKNQPTEIRLSALKEFASYGHSKLKTIEHTGANGEPLEFKMNIVNNILQLVDSEYDTSKVIDAIPVK